MDAVDVNYGIAVEQQFINGNKLITVGQGCFNQGRQILFDLESVVVAEDYGAGLYLGKHPVQDCLCASFLLPVYRVDILLNNFVTGTANGFDNVVVIFAVRCAEDGRTLSDDGFNQVIVLF